MESVAAWALRFLDEHAQIALFIWLFLEEAGVPMPVPGDLVVLAAGTRISLGQIHWVVAILLVEAATLLGSSILYFLARRGGRPFLNRFGRYLMLDQARIARTEEVLQRRGFLAVVIGRLTPGLRITTTFAAGALGVPYRQFAPASLIGSNNLPFLILGFFAGPQVLRAIEGFRSSTHLVGVAIGLAAVVTVFVLIRRRAKLRAAPSRLSPAVRLEVALWAGALATATTVAVLNLELYLLAALDQTTASDALIMLGRAAVRHLGTESLPIVLIGGTLGYMALHMLWALVYARVEPWLPRPDWVGGLLFAVLPLLVSLLVLLPVLGVGVAGRHLDLGPALLVSEVLRNGIFGWALATSFTLLSRARGARLASQLAQAPDTNRSGWAARVARVKHSWRALHPRSGEEVKQEETPAVGPGPLVVVGATGSEVRETSTDPRLRPPS